MTTATPTKLPTVASRLKNGAWVLAAKPASGGVPGSVVLGFHSGAGAVHPFCTWWVRYDGHAFSGDYYADLGEAYAAYAERT